MSEDTQLAESIAALLEGEWKVEAREGMQGVYLVSADGDELHAYRNWRDSSRLVISGNLVPSVWYHGVDPRDLPSTHDLNPAAREITVSAARPAKAMAGEITRRLLPTYREQAAEWRRRIDQHNAAKRRQSEVAGRLAKVLGVEPSDEGRVHFYRDLGVPKTYCSGDFTVNGDGEVKIELNWVPAEIAVKIAGLVKS